MCSRTVYWHGVTYVVALSIDLNGETLSVRENCVLKFNSRGSFNDEVVKGEKMIVEGLSKKKFFNVLICDFWEVYQRYYAFASDVWLVFLEVSVLQLEKGRVYNVDRDIKPYVYAIYKYDGISQR